MRFICQKIYIIVIILYQYVHTRYDSANKNTFFYQKLDFSLSLNEKSFLRFFENDIATLVL